MTAATSLQLDGRVPPEIVSSVFHSATVSEHLAILVAETSGGSPRLSWGNQGAVSLLGYAIEDLRKVSVQQLFPTLRGGELGLLLRRERSTQMTVPVRSASGELIEASIAATPVPGRPDVDAARLAGDHERPRACAARDRRRPRAPVRHPHRALAGAHAAVRAGHAAGARQRRVLLAGRPPGRAAAGHRLDDLRAPRRPRRPDRAGRRRPRGRRRRDSAPVSSGKTARPGRPSSASPTCSPPASAPVSSARSRTSPTGWPSRRSWSTRPTTTR